MLSRWPRQDRSPELLQSRQRLFDEEGGKNIDFSGFAHVVVKVLISTTFKRGLQRATIVGSGREDIFQALLIGDLGVGGASESNDRHFESVANQKIEGWIWCCVCSANSRHL